MEAILDWLVPGKNLQYGGEVVGSRYGVTRVLEQGYGRCWDFADCFVTFCRAAGLPARQVGGWIFDRSGHVWGEVYIAAEGWVQVDPSTGTRCGSEYIPYILTEDGEWPFVYASPVKVERMAGAED